MLGFHVQSAGDHRLHHLVADVHQLVRRRHREIAFLVPQLVAQIRLLVPAPVPLALDAVDVVEALVRFLVEADVVKNEELRLRPQIRRVGNARALQIVRRLTGHVPRIARIVFPRDRILDVADDRQRRDRGERIDERRVRLRHDQHVALVDRLPAADARAVEPQPVLEHVLVQLVDRDGQVLPQPREIHEPQVDRLDILFTTQSQQFFGSH